MKHTLTAVLTLILLTAFLLAGCQVSSAEPLPLTSPTVSTAAPTVPTTAPTVPATAPIETEPVDIRPLPPDNPGSSLCDYDPNRQLYILGEDLHEEFYANVDLECYLQFRLFSKEPVDTTSISVQLPLDLTYRLKQPVSKVSLKDGIEAGTVQTYGRVDNNVALEYNLYQVYRNPQGPFSKNDYDLTRDYLSLLPEDIPDFHVYILTIICEMPQEIPEAVQIPHVDITIEGQTHRVELAEVWLRPEAEYYAGMDYKTGMPDQERFPEFTAWGAVHGIMLCNEGYIELGDLYSFEKIQGTMTLSNLRLRDPEAQILELIVSLNSHGSTKRYTWDGQTPIELNPGDSICIVIRYYDPDMAGFWSRDTIWAVMDAVVDGEEMCVSSWRKLEAGYNYYEQYAIIFDGVDVEPFYRDFYYTYSHPWRNDYR